MDKYVDWPNKVEKMFLGLQLLVKFLPSDNTHTDKQAATCTKKHYNCNISVLELRMYV